MNNWRREWYPTDWDSLVLLSLSQHSVILRDRSLLKTPWKLRPKGQAILTTQQTYWNISLRINILFQMHSIHHRNNCAGDCVACYFSTLGQKEKDEGHSGIKLWSIDDTFIDIIWLTRTIWLGFWTSRLLSFQCHHIDLRSFNDWICLSSKVSWY